MKNLIKRVFLQPLSFNEKFKRNAYEYLIELPDSNEIISVTSDRGTGAGEKEGEVDVSLV